MLAMFCSRRVLTRGDRRAPCVCRPVQQQLPVQQQQLFLHSPSPAEPPIHETEVLRMISGVYGPYTQALAPDVNR
jgi:hypothetical protein